MVTGNDEMTPTYFEILKRAGYVGNSGQVAASEASVAMMLSCSQQEALCEIERVELFYAGENRDEFYKKTREKIEKLLVEYKVDGVVVGVNGTEENDSVYNKILEDIPLNRLKYKHLFGECYTVSALGVYAAAHILKAGAVPHFLRCDGEVNPLSVNRLLFVNHSDGKELSLVMLKAVDK